MRLLYVVLFGAATFTSVDASVATSYSNTATMAQDSVPGSRLLRTSATTNLDSEERVAIKVPSSITNELVGGVVSKITPAITSKFATTDDELVKLLNKGVLPKDVFRGTLNLHNVDDLFANPSLNTWVNYMNAFNTKYPTEKTTMFKTLTDSFDDKSCRK